MPYKVPYRLYLGYIINGYFKDDACIGFDTRDSAEKAAVKYRARGMTTKILVYSLKKDRYVCLQYILQPARCSQCLQYIL